MAELGAVHMRWTDPAMWAGSPRWVDFFSTFILSLLSHFNQKVCFDAEKRLFWSGSF